MYRTGLIFLMATAACGGDDDGGVHSDAAPMSDAAPVDAVVDLACNPVAQSGCAEGKKCSWLLVDEDPVIGRTACVPDGDAALGESCNVGAPGETTGYDDCAAGGLCTSGICTPICSIAPDSCGDGACAATGGAFGDDANLGVCDFVCDPVAQDCSDATHGCYLHIGSGAATCSEVAAGAEELTQDELCAMAGTECLVNGCAKGYGIPGADVPRRCAAYCSPVETYLIDPDGDGAGALVGGADADGAAPADCTEARIGIAGSSCRFIQSFFIDTNTDYLSYVPDSYGVCTGTFATFGDCTGYSREWSLELYNDVIEGGGTPETAAQEIATRCSEDPDKCALGCMKVATMDALEAAYCEVPDNSTRPTCVAGLLGARIARRSLEKYWAERMIRASAAVR